MGRETILAAAEEEEAVSFPPFLRYDAPTVVPGAVTVRDDVTGPSSTRGAHTSSNGSSRCTQYENITLLDAASAAQHSCSIPASKLAAAKAAAREAFLASQASAPAAAAAAAATPSPTAAVSNARKDPAHRLPTPPIAGRRHMAASGTGRRDARGSRLREGDGGKVEKDSVGGKMAAVKGAAGGPTSSKAAGAAETIAAAAPLSLSQQQQKQQQTMSALMRTAHKPDSFAVQVLNSLFPPHMAVMELDDGPEAAPGGRPDVWNEETEQSSEGGSSSTNPGILRPIRVQHVSRAPATREEVALLHDSLRQRLQERRAKPSDLCPIRREIYDDVFRELIRQVTVEEPARGVLLQRIKADSDHTRQVHADLLARAHLFAARKTKEAVGGCSRCDHGSPAPQGAAAPPPPSMQALRERLDTLHNEKTVLEARRHELLTARNRLERKIDEERLARNKAYQQELAYLRRANQQLSLRLKAETERSSANNPANTEAAASEAAGEGTSEVSGVPPSE